jgi:hypothetical protein
MTVAAAITTGSMLACGIDPCTDFNGFEIRPVPVGCYDVTREIGNTGVVGLLRNGKGPTV